MLFKNTTTADIMSSNSTNLEHEAFELKQSGGGWQFLTKPAYHKTVALINGDKFIKSFSSNKIQPVYSIRR